MRDHLQIGLEDRDRRNAPVATEAQARLHDVGRFGQAVFGANQAHLCGVDAQGELFEITIAGNGDGLRQAQYAVRASTPAAIAGDSGESRERSRIGDRREGLDEAARQDWLLRIVVEPSLRAQRLGRRGVEFQAVVCMAANRGRRCEHQASAAKCVCAGTRRTAGQQCLPLSIPL